MFKLLKKDTKFEWTDECEQFFQTIKNDILQEPFLQLLQFHKQFILTKDGSFPCVGGCLSQRYDDGLRPVAYFPRSLKASENNYGAFNIELMAVIDTIRHFKVYLVGKPFLILTDCKSLVPVLKKRKATTKKSSKMATGIIRFFLSSSTHSWFPKRDS